MAAESREVLNDDVQSLQKIFEADGAELARSERTHQQFSAVLLTLQKRADEMEAESQRLSMDLLTDSDCVKLENEVARGEETAQALDSEYSEMYSAMEKTRRLCDEKKSQTQLAVQSLQEIQNSIEALAVARVNAEEECTASQAEGRSMVSSDVLQRAEDESARVHSQLEEQQAETSRLRQALADSWAARAEDVDPSDSTAASSTEDLDRMEEEVKWLAKVQQEAADERRHLQKLERSEAALQSELREVSEEKAALQSARVDLGDTGRAMREAIAHQSEGYVQRLEDLEIAKRTADEDRAKLLQECADLQARLDAATPELESIVELEERHLRLDKERRAVTDECERLRVVNGALGALLLGSDAPPPIPMEGGGGDESDAGGVPEAISRVMQLRLRLVQRLEAHAEEKLRLVDRIRLMERENAQGAASLVLPSSSPSSKTPQVSRPAPEPQSAGRLAAATSLFKDGLGLIRDVALPAR
eukprot:TRINITY_DN43933_c0_g1_i1.p1 TRINITY_DN43933_c0_g1~~TRINITY_DN43933_c0_g1_i1.p1  ORF type:complete len:493 (-),score=136.97 TRINITY_DN43933_c0_g1_i1:36-1466(-)